MVVDQKFEERLQKLEVRVSKLENLFKETGAEVKSKKELSIKEFILSKKPGNDVEKTLAIGYYFEKFEGLASYNVNDLVSGFRKAKETVPKNMNDKVYMCSARGFMMEAEQKKDNMKAWVLTNSGEEYVERGFKNA